MTLNPPHFFGILLPMPEQFITQSIHDKALDVTLRPAVFEDFVGQSKIKERLEILVEAANGRVTLRGKVRSWAERQDAERGVTRTAGPQSRSCATTST